MNNLVNVALVQHACGTDKQANLAASLSGIAEAAAQGAQLVCLPELHTSRYFCQTADPKYHDWAEPIPGPSSELLQQAAQSHQIVVVGSLYERRAPGLYHNTAVVYDNDGSYCGRYRKMHIPDDPGYYEKYYFTPGDLGFAPIETSLGRLGVLICWDQWFPEAARLMSLRGADLLLYPTAIGWDPNDDSTEQQRQLQAWQIMQQSHAISNHLPVISCNRFGFEPDPSGQTAGQRFWGHSFIADQQGQIVAQANSTTSSVTVATVDLGKTEQLRRVWPYLRDRRVEAYQGLLQRWLE